MTIQDEISAISDLIAKHCNPQKIILFGSAARGDFGSDSDIDLLVIKDSDKKRPYRTKEIFEAVRKLDRSYALDPLVYTPEEIRERILLGDYFIQNILKEGKVIYGQQ